MLMYVFHGGRSPDVFLLIVREVVDTRSLHLEPLLSADTVVPTLTTPFHHLLYSDLNPRLGIQTPPKCQTEDLSF